MMLREIYSSYIYMYIIAMDSLVEWAKGITNQNMHLKDFIDMYM